MGKSLQDQLLKAGLVDEKQAKKINAQKRKKSKQKLHNRSATADEKRSQVEKLLAENTDRDRLLNRQRTAQAKQKAIAAQIKQLIESNRQSKGEEDVPFNFTDNAKVKRIWISEPVRKKIYSGRLAIVNLNGEYELVPPEIAEKIRHRSEKTVVLYNDPSEPQQDKDNESDPYYADYDIPDDLIW